MVAVGEDNVVEVALDETMGGGAEEQEAEQEF